MQSDAPNWILNFSHCERSEWALFITNNTQTHRPTHWSTDKMKWLYLPLIHTTSHCLVYFNSTTWNYQEIGRSKGKRRKKKKRKRKEKLHTPKGKVDECMHLLQLCHSVCAISRRSRRSSVWRMAVPVYLYAKQYGNNEKLVATESTQSITWFSCLSIA